MAKNNSIAANEERWTLPANIDEGVPLTVPITMLYKRSIPRDQAGFHGRLPLAFLMDSADCWKNTPSKPTQ